MMNKPLTDKEITYLLVIQKRPGKLNWYSLRRTMSALEMNLDDLPEVIARLKNAGFIEGEIPSGEKFERFRVTEKGQQALAATSK